VYSEEVFERQTSPMEAKETIRNGCGRNLADSQLANRKRACVPALHENGLGPGFTHFTEDLMSNPMSMGSTQRTFQKV